MCKNTFSAIEIHSMKPRRENTFDCDLNTEIIIQYFQTKRNLCRISSRFSLLGNPSEKEVI